MEIGGEEISFLDGTHEFGIFCKATTTDILVRGSSFYLNSYKMAASNALAHRHATIPMNDHEFRKAINVMKQLARFNEVPVNIDRLVGKTNV